MKLNRLLIVMLTLLLTACGGGGGGVPSEAVTGGAVKGPLANAVVAV